MYLLIILIRIKHGTITIHSDRFFNDLNKTGRNEWQSISQLNQGHSLQSTKCGHKKAVPK